jgi:type I restriction enzyme M protein
MVDRRHRELTAEEIKKIADTYHAWRGIDEQKVEYSDIAGFCKTAKLDEIRKQGHILTPGRYVGMEEDEEKEGAFDEKMKQLTAELGEQMEEGKRLDAEIKKNLDRIGWNTA